MSIRMLTFGAIALLAMSSLPVVNVASAMPIDRSNVIRHADATNPYFVQYRRYHGHGHGGHGGDGAGVAAGLLGGMILGGMLARPGYYDYAPGPFYGSGYSADASEAYCMRRFRSYDPSSGTYLGYDGYRHPCP